MSEPTAGEVRYLVNVMERAYLVAYRLAIAPTALSQAHADRLRATLEQAREAIAATVEGIAMEIGQTGVCPWCNELAHPKGQHCA